MSTFAWVLVGILAAVVGTIVGSYVLAFLLDRYFADDEGYWDDPDEDDFEQPYIFPLDDDPDCDEDSR